MKIAKHALSIVLLVWITSILFAQAAGKLTNADVIDMTHKGMSVAEITHVIMSNPTNFDISYPAMLQLQQSGVDPAVGNLMMNVTVGKVVSAQLDGKTTMDVTLPPEVPLNGGAPGQQQKVSVAPTTMLSDDQFRAQQDQVVQTLAEHGCFGPDGPKLVMEGRAMMCQGASSNMAPGSSASIAGATTSMSSGFLIGGNHSITTVPANANFEIDLGEVPGTSMAGFKPLLVRLASSSYGRIVSHTNMKVVAKFPMVRFETDLQDDVVPTIVALNSHRSLETSNLVYEIKPAAPLPPGEYGVVLRRDGSPNMRIRDASHDPAMGIVQAVWDFRVAP